MGECSCGESMCGEESVCMGVCVEQFSIFVLRYTYMIRRRELAEGRNTYVI